MIKAFSRLLLLAGLLQLAACDNKTKSMLGLAPSSPDEFNVITNQSLVIPPQFTLPNPKQSNQEDKKVSSNNLSAEDKKFINKINSNK